MYSTVLYDEKGMTEQSVVEWISSHVSVSQRLACCEFESQFLQTSETGTLFNIYTFVVAEWLLTRLARRLCGNVALTVSSSPWSRLDRLSLTHDFTVFVTSRWEVWEAHRSYCFLLSAGSSHSLAFPGLTWVERGLVRRSQSSSQVRSLGLVLSLAPATHWRL